MPKRIYDFIDEGGENVIDAWLDGIDKTLRGRVAQKLDALMTVETELPPKMLTDTKYPQIKELRINSKEALRLLLCKGPDPKLKAQEFTLLYGAAERDSKYVPRDALQRAETNRLLVLKDQNRHRKLRKYDEEA
ncbi:MAG: hypothetical protein ACRDHZ_16560 [Ktedonobacteraceae bacterium]